MAQVLCIGMTGMLAGCVRSLVARGDRVACIARTQDSLTALAETIPRADQPRISTHACDYRDLDAFDETLAALEFEPQSTICWVHSPAEPVIDRIRRRFPGIDLLRVIASATQAPLCEGGNPHRTVRLGFVIENDQSRWLRDDEIARGVYEAFINNERDACIGVVEPWDRRP